MMGWPFYYYLASYWLLYIVLTDQFVAFLFGDPAEFSQRFLELFFLFGCPDLLSFILEPGGWL